MLRLTLSRVAVMYAAMLSSQVCAQAVSTHVPVATRLVQIYSDYEARLVNAIHHRDTGEIGHLVADDFELRSANNIGVPTPRAEWVAQLLKEPSDSISIGQMAVHDYGNVRIVSFTMKRTAGGRREPAIAVIDVWMLSGENSILKVRYAAVQGSPSARVPGEFRPRQIRKKY